MSFENTNRYDEPDNEMLDEVRSSFAEFEKYGFAPGWAESIIEQYPVKLTKLAAVTEELTPDHFIGEDMNEVEPDFDPDDVGETIAASMEAYKSYKWIAVLEMTELSLEIITTMFDQFSQLSDEELRELWDDREAVREDHDSFEEFRAEIRRTSQAMGLISAFGGGMMGDMIGGMATYSDIPEEGETRMIEYVEPEGQVIGAYDLTETETGHHTSADVRVAEGEIIEFIEPEDDIDKALMHPPARVRVDGQEYIVPPSNIRNPDGSSDGPTMTGMDGLLGDMEGGELGGMGDLGGLDDLGGGGDLGDLLGGGSDTDDFRFDADESAEDPFDLNADDGDEDGVFHIDGEDIADPLDDDPTPPDWVDDDQLDEGDGEDDDTDSLDSDDDAEDDDVREFDTDRDDTYWR